MVKSNILLFNLENILKIKNISKFCNYFFSNIYTYYSNI